MSLRTQQLPKYEQIRRHLIQQIVSGRWDRSTPLPSDARLVKQFSVSRPTLIRAMQELAREGYVRREKGRGSFVSDRFTTNGGNQPGQRVDFFISADAARAIGEDRLILTSLEAGIAEETREHHATVHRHVVPMDSTVDDLRKRFGNLPLETAVVLEPVWTPHILGFLRGIECTFWIANESVNDENCVVIDQVRACYLATRCLIEEGRRNIALINDHEARYWGFTARRLGYERALTEAGLEIDKRVMLQGPERDTPLSSESGRMMMRQLLDQMKHHDVEVDAIVCTDDRKAIGAMAAAREAGLRIPDDLAFVGIDDNLADRAEPPLTSVHMPVEEVGRLAMSHALASLKDRSSARRPAVHIVVAPHLVLRETGGAPLSDREVTHDVSMGTSSTLSHDLTTAT